MNLYPLHRVLVENKIGRLLTKFEVVHHIDGNKGNDDPCNLEIKTPSEHAAHHGKERSSLQEVQCKCGKLFSVKSHIFRLRNNRNKTGAIYCSRSCGGRYGSL